MNTRYTYYVLSGLVVLVASLLLFVANSYKQEKITHELNTQLNLNSVYFQEAYNNYLTLANNVNMFILSSQKNIDIFKQAYLSGEEKRHQLRQRLYEQLQPGYPRLQQTGFRQIHYHLPDNTSFLRMHKPEMYGDTLTDIRHSIKTVNQTLKPISGFEEGRIVNGFRFVFPLFDENGTHIGSAEASVSSLAFIRHIEQIYHSDVHFIIKKSVASHKLWAQELKAHYKDSLESPHYYAETESLKHHFADHDQDLHMESSKPLILEKLETGKPFSFYSGHDKIISFLPIHNIEKNQTIAYFVIYDENNIISETNSVFLLAIVLTLLFSITLLLLIRSEYRSKIRIETVNQKLTERIQQEVEKSQKKDRQIMEQSRLSQMGEMISMIAHQWRQPLGAIASTVIDLKMRIELQAFNLEIPREREEFHAYLNQSLSDVDRFVQNLTTTINDFRNFYKQNKKVERLALSEPIQQSLDLMKGSLESQDVTLTWEHSCSKNIMIYPNELVQVILNILKNALDNFQEKHIKEKCIYIHSVDTTRGVDLEICDNGGGIPEKIMNKIFDPYFSTKNAKNGTGLGLYMSKIIIEDHHGGNLTVKNCHQGACFTISLKETL